AGTVMARSLDLVAVGRAATPTAAAAVRRRPGQQRGRLAGGRREVLLHVAQQGVVAPDLIDMAISALAHELEVGPGESHALLPAARRGRRGADEHMCVRVLVVAMH